MKYTEIISEISNTKFIQLDNNGVISIIPCDPANSDYQAYLKWLEENPSGTIS